MTEVLGEESHPVDSAVGTSSPADDSSRHLGRYPVRLPTPSDPRLHLAAVTITLQVLGQTVFDFNVSIAQILLSIATCGLIELAVVFNRERVVAWPASALLTGNGIALILRVPGTEPGDWWSLRGWWVFVGASALAMATKYLIRRNGRHVFNPSNIALVLTFVVLGETRADPQVLWWGPLSPGLVMAFAVILVGSIAVTRRVRQGVSALSYWITFAVFVALIAASGHTITANWHVGPIGGWDYWLLLVTSPEVLVFLFFMITDPRTAPAKPLAQTAYGVAIAAAGALIIATQSGEFGTKVGVLAGLALLSPFVPLLERRVPALTAVRPRAALPLAAGGFLLLAVVLLLLARSPAGSNHEPGAVDRRDEVTLELSALPEVSIDDALDSTSLALTQVEADQLAHDVVQDLLIEASAITTADSDLAAAGLTGGRLAQVEQTIAESRLESPVIEYRVDALTATVARIGSSPQAPPRLAVRVAGVLTVGSEPQPFEGTFLTEQSQGANLIARAVSTDGAMLPPPLFEPGLGPDELALEGLPEAPENRPADIPAPIAAGDPALGGMTFTEVTSNAGLDEGHSSIVLTDDEGMTSGVAVADVDADGDDDLFLPRFGKPDGLYLNDGLGTFTDVADAAGVAGPDDGQGSATGAFADIDGDDDLDLFVAGAGTRRNMLYINHGNGSFSEAAIDRGLVWPALADSTYGNQTHDVAFADVNNDGAMDLLVLQWRFDLTEGGAAVDVIEEQVAVRDDDLLDRSACARYEVLRSAGFPLRDSADVNRSALFLNDGSGNFIDSTEDLGLPLDEIVAFTGSFNDLDGDGWQDLAITGDYCTSRLLRNVDGQRFEDVTQAAGVGTDENGMGSVVSDIDRDGDPDWFVTSISNPSDQPPPLPFGSGNRLYLNNGNMTFEDRTDDFGLRDGGWGWGAAVEDWNNDGTPEIAMTNGFDSNILREDTTAEVGMEDMFSKFLRDRTRFWVRDDGTYRDAAAAVGIDDTTVGHGMVAFDMDNDGDLDLLITPSNGSPRLYRNDTPPTNHWLAVSLDDPSAPGNRWGDGARVEVTTSDKGDPILGWITTGGSYETQKPPVFHVGLGDHESAIARVEVFWPGEEEPQVLENVPVDQQLVVRRDG